MKGSLSGPRRVPAGKTILLIGKYPPIEGGVSAHDYWLAQAFAELGYNVIVLTNADEVEDTDRMRLAPGDRVKLGGYRVSGSVAVISTKMCIRDRHSAAPLHKRRATGRSRSICLYHCRHAEQHRVRP